MKSRYFILSLFLCFCFLSCGDKESYRDVEMKVLGMLGSENLIIGSEFEFDAGSAIITKSDFYISDIQLVQSDGSTHDALDIGFINISLTHDELESSKIGSSLNLSKVPVGAYNKVRFSIGVPSDLNATQPADYPNSNPLSNASHYWTAWSSYIFQKIQGKYDADNDGTLETDFFYHTGSNGLLRTLEFEVNFDVSDNEGNELVFEIDHKALLGEGTIYLDIENNPGQHEIEHIDQITKMADNLSSSFKMIQ